MANGINLYYGPDPNATLNKTEGVSEDGRITQAHPIWGVLTLTIPFLPMLVFAPLLAMIVNDEEGLSTKIGWVCLAIALSLPFTAVATPIYVLYVIGVGIFRVIAPNKLKDDYKAAHGYCKTAEISMESAIQTCLGK